MLAVMKHVVRPIIYVTEKTAPLQEGCLNLELDYHANNELGDLSKTIESSMELIHRYVGDINHIMGRLSEGNFDVHTSEHFIGDFKSIERSIDSFTSIIFLCRQRVSRMQIQNVCSRLVQFLVQRLHLGTQGKNCIIFRICFPIKPLAPWSA